MLLYIDNSVLNRPFDDQRQPRVWLETLAFSLVLSLIESRQAEMVESAIHRRENDVSPSLLGRRFVEKCLRLSTVRPALNDAVRLRATELNAQGLGPLDALHLAMAEEAAADYFLSCDDRIVRRYSGKLLVQNPQTFINTLGPTT